jgi:Tfp pilus assembly protein PilE
MLLGSTRANVRGNRRRSFTLVELITVLAIITLIVGLSIGAVMATINLRHWKDTAFTMTELNSAINKHWTAVSQQAATENWNTPDMTTPLPGNTLGPLATIRQWAANDDRRARVMYVKFRQKQEFPTSFSEALNPYPLPPKKAYVAYLNQLGITGSTSATAPYESAACLYMAMTLSTSGTEFKADQFGNAVHEFPTPNGQQIKAFTDDWNHALMFSRWPTGDPNLPALCPIPSQYPTLISIRDKDDWDGKLIDQNWQSANPTSVTQFQTYGHLITNSQGPLAYYVIPVIVSAGADGNFGIATGDATLTQTNAGAAHDNIYSYNLGK